MSTHYESTNWEGKDAFMRGRQQGVQVDTSERIAEIKNLLKLPIHEREGSWVGIH
ncbi:hypothetical protein N9850_13070 [Granulosicoccus sp.]|nr:hypothetical protein [Granulosicoccus sp.]MDB4224698.1 hypothetical protein [Granulosicoccus sp.]